MALHGTSKAYILDRLRREQRTEFINAIEAGQITALTAAVELGWVRRPATLGANGSAAKRRQHQLRAIAGDGNALSRLGELWLGPADDGSFFDSPEDLRAAWENDRDTVIRVWANNGRRPQAWWVFEAPQLGLKWPGYFREQSYLYEAGVLEEVERTELLSFWRAEFERSYRPGFFHHTGSEILHGVRARRAHYRWADIPDGLVEAWTAAHRRRGRQEAPSEEAAAGTTE